MWTARNDFVHARDENGRLVKEKEETEQAIAAQFELEFEDLRPQDRHLIEQGQDAVLRKTATEQRAWLHYIRVARQVGSREMDSTVTQLRDFMASWLERRRD